MSRPQKPSQKRSSELRQRGFRFVAGVDEAGRGPLAGPVVAAACLVSSMPVEGIDDSKKLTRAKRCLFYDQLTSHPDVRYGVGIVDAGVIDEINILQATIRAMQEAVSALDPAPDYLLVDGLQLPYPEVPVEKVIGGDAICYSIAAASVIAKEVRDRLMEGYDEQWPEYGFAKHKGYGTALHRAALLRHGPCEIHRKSFAPINKLS